MIKKIIRNIGLLTITRIITQIIALFVTVYISRILGVENYGKIGFVTAIFLYFDRLSSLGLETYSIREVARDESNIKYFIHNSIALRLSISIILVIIIILFQDIVFSSKEIGLLLSIYSINLFFKSISINWTFAALQRLELYGITTIVLNITYFIGVIIFVKKPSDIFYVPISFLTGNVAAVIYTWIFQKNKGHNLKLQIDLKNWKRILKNSLPMVLAFMIMNVDLNFGIIILGFSGNETEVGLYSAALKFIIFLIAFREILVTVSYPLLSKYFIESHDRLKQVMDGFLKLSITFALPITFGGILLAPEIISTIFGKQFIDAQLPFRILLIGFVFRMINIVYPGSQNAFNKQNTYLKISIINSAVNVALIFIFMYLFGWIGAAIATASTDLLALILFKRESNKTILIKFLQPLTRAIIPTTIMLIALLLISPLNIFLKILIGVFVYTAGLFIFRTIPKEDYEVLKNIVFYKNEN